MKFLIYILISLEMMQCLFFQVTISVVMDPLVLFYSQIQIRNFGIGPNAS